MNESTFGRNEAEKLSRVMNAIPMEAVRRVAIGGTPDEAIEQIERYIRAGVIEFALAPVPTHFEETMSMYKKHIIPYFRERSQ
jgi:alkanesulfonate monooxygenase SsuD/methylene tetrahydromethanopterin reductase-like flavin-dependent oxidoreductase (luciferase family)